MWWNLCVVKLLHFTSYSRWPSVNVAVIKLMHQFLLPPFSQRRKNKLHLSQIYTNAKWDFSPLVITVWKHVEHLKVISNMRSTSGAKLRLISRKAKRRFLLGCFSDISSLFILLQEASGPFSTLPNIHTFYFAPVWVTFKFFFFLSEAHWFAFQKNIEPLFVFLVLLFFFSPSRGGVSWRRWAVTHRLKHVTPEAKTLRLLRGKCA